MNPGPSGETLALLLGVAAFLTTAWGALIFASGIIFGFGQ